MPENDEEDFSHPFRDIDPSDCDSASVSADSLSPALFFCLLVLVWVTCMILLRP
jgi:hypothetical protein